MHIVQVTNDFPPIVGGMATHAWELSKALARLGHSVTVLTGASVYDAQSRFAPSRCEMRDGVQVFNLGFKLFLRRYYGLYFDHVIRRWLRKASQASGDCVLHVHEHRRPENIRKLSSLPMLWTNHSSMFLRDFEDQTKRERMRRIVSSCDWITAPSRELCEKTAALGYPGEHITYIPNGVDTERFSRNGTSDDRAVTVDGTVLHIPPRACVVLCARRFVHKNGLHVYLDALEQMPPALLKECVFLFAGNAPGKDEEYGQQISERIMSLSRVTATHLLGLVPNDSMPALYQAADIAVLPSLKEATSITGLEAMASGLPIVGTDVGGIPEIVKHGTTGLLCSSGDGAALARNLAKLIEDQNARRQMGANAWSLAHSSFSWERIASKFVHIYETMLSDCESTAHTSGEIYHD